MSNPIKETPTLYGEEARKFIEIANNNEKDTSNRISRESYEESKKLYEEVLENATFKF